MQILDHVDLRVRNITAATAFYDGFLPLLGGVKRVNAEFTTWRIPPADGELDDAPDSFGIVEDRAHVADASRIALKAQSRAVVDAIAGRLSSLGARNIEMDDGIYGDGYYGVFFEDLDGNRLEVCVQ